MDRRQSFISRRQRRKLQALKCTVNNDSLRYVAADTISFAFVASSRQLIISSLERRFVLFPIGNHRSVAEAHSPEWRAVSVTIYVTRLARWEGATVRWR